ncbi:MAG: hypothetical protein ABSF53_26345, partial [Terracidiphilus sp.]
KWWNWQTHHLEGVAPKGVGVQIPPSAPGFRFVCTPLILSSAVTSALRPAEAFNHMVHSSPGDLKPALCREAANSENRSRISEAVPLNIAEQENFPATRP